MTTKSTNFKKKMTTELTNFIQSQARGLSPADPYLSGQLKFLSLVVKDQVAGLNRDLTAQTAAEAAYVRSISRTRLI